MFFLILSIFGGSLKVKLPTIWTNEKAEVGRIREEKRRKKIREEKESEERRSEKKKSQKKEDAGLMQARGKVEKSRNIHCAAPATT